jgi:outer membrane immunogenic protein
MRKIIVTLCFVCFASLVLHAQDDKRIGALLGYGSEIESLGVGANAEFPIIENLTIAPSFMFFLPNDQDFVKTTIFEINANANYYFSKTESLSFYGLGGLNYTSVKVQVEDFGLGLGDFSSNTGRIGLNIGAGANFNIGSNWLPFAELKYVLGDFDQLVIAAGVKFNL